jgi:hypothetical protein
MDEVIDIALAPALNDGNKLLKKVHEKGKKNKKNEE